LKVPVGVVNVARGGTGWPFGLENLPTFPQSGVV
jgi:hypothetical protein